MEKHNGQITEYLVRKHGYSITDLAINLNVNRRSIYNYFQNRNLKPDIILKIGLVIRHDFSKEFPDLFAAEDFIVLAKQNQATSHKLNDSDEEVWKEKYIALLEKHSNLLVNCVDKTGVCCNN